MEYHDTNQGRMGRSSGSAMWRRKPGQSTETLRIQLHHPPQTDTLKLSTDNGDNAALQLTSIRVSHPVVRLLFRAADTTPVHLCYGHRSATYPRYDLDLVRREFETATKVSASLGEEKTLSGHKSMPTQSSGSGSPWLWAALTLVVGGLLWIVAKMLPKQI
jgi:3',5'-cyclic AMP phosphodiesterase CpdA